MKKTLDKFRNSAFQRFLKQNEKYALVAFFIGGFIFDSLTLGRIDRVYDITILCLHMILLTTTIYLFNLAPDGRWRKTFINNYEDYFPLAIQFFFGALSSAYVIYFSRSVSLSKTASFFVILLILFLTNELLRNRISNKYLQFSVYFFISFVFYAFMLPVFVKEVSPTIFLISGLISISLTTLLIIFIYRQSPSTRVEVKKGKLFGIILGIYLVVNLFYYFKLIPPVPLALNEGIVAHDIKVDNGKYFVKYESDDWFIFWRDHTIEYHHNPADNVYVFSSIFAPTAITKEILHRWKRYNEETAEWEIVEDIGYDIVGGRDNGYRGYTYKNNVTEGEWRVEVITEEELILGIIDFDIIVDSSLQPQRLKTKSF